ncbi:OadG family protein [Porphyromonas sp.]
MNIARKLYLLSLGLSLAIVPMVAWAQDHPQLSEKVQKLAERDPAGGIMTFTAVLVVFLALLMLVLIFRGIGMFFQTRNTSQKGAQTAPEKASAPRSIGTPSSEALVAISLALQSAVGTPDEVAIAIALALRSELETQHDQESYVLTIRHRPTMWNVRIPRG